jgi:hypothetical protein
MSRFGVKSSVVEPELEPQEPKLFSSVKPELECIPDPVPKPDLDPGPTWNGIQKSKKLTKWDANFLGNNAASKSEKAKFSGIF